MATTIRGIWPASAGLGVPKSLRRSCAYEAYVPDPLMGRRIFLPPDVVTDLGEAESAIRHLNASGSALSSLEAMARLLLRAEAIGSSRIEGLEVNARRLVRAEAARILGQSAGDVTAEAILGNIEAMQLAMSGLAGQQQLSIEGLLSLHAALMHHTTRPDLGGRLRTTQNWIGGNDFSPCGADFVPPPPELVPQLMEDMIAYLNSVEHPPIIQAALTHLQFETIHPFADGNGRVGRTLIHIVLHRRGLCPRYVPPISLVLATQSRAYISGLSAARYPGPSDSPQAYAGLSKWLSVFATATVRAAKDAELFGEQVNALTMKWRAAFLEKTPIRGGSSVDLLLRVLPVAPVITVATAAQLIGRSVQAANSAVERLVDVGVLVPIRSVRWRRAFEAQGLLDVFTNFERALASPTGDTRDAAPARPVPARPRRRED